jgi:transposase-like protein
MLGAMETPVGGRDYPRALREFNVRFPDEEACLDYLVRLRWPGGFACPVCRGSRFWRMSKGRNLRCAGCRVDASITAGTIFADTRLPLTAWFAAAWYVTGTKHGVSALSLQRVLGLGSYETAWALLHKLRRAMVRPGRDRLSREVEVDESYVGGVAVRGKHGRGAGRKAIVAIAVEKRGPGMGRIRLGRIHDTSADSLLPFIEEAIEPGSVVSTDGHLGYKPLATTCYIHDRRSIQASGDPGTSRCPASTASPPCSNAGSSARTKAPSARSSSTTTSTSSRSASTAAARTTAACSSTTCSSRLFSSTTSHSPRSRVAAHSVTPHEGA